MVVEGTRAVGRPKRRWRDCVDNYLKDRGMDLENSEYEDREIWKSLTTNSDPIQKREKLRKKMSCIADASN